MRSRLFAVLAALPATMWFCASVAADAGTARIDHVILGVADLDRGTDLVEKLTGVRPVYGGKHPGGTHNALLSLGKGIYLELLAVQPDAKAPEDLRDLARLESPAPVGWAVSTTEPSELASRLEKAGFPVTPPESGSRVTPGGLTLRWHSFDLATELGQAPFFIAWSADTAHPSTTSPAGCSFRSLRVAANDVANLERLRSALALQVEIVQADRPGFVLSLDCPKGRVTFST